MRWPWDVRNELKELRTFRAEVASVMDQNLLLLTRLEERITQLRDDWVYERERADRAVDSLLASKGLASILPSTPVQMEAEQDPFAEDPKEVNRILAEMGLGPKKATDA
jgi:hypothetical protein